MSYHSLNCHLESLKQLLTTLVDLAQQEQAHLIAFEPKALEEVNDARALLLDEQNDLESLIRDELAKIRAELNLTEEQAPTLAAIATHLPEEERASLEQHCNCLRALSGSLQELHKMNAVQAERGLRTVRSYLTLLVDSVKEEGPETYDGFGRTRTNKWRAAAETSV